MTGGPALVHVNPERRATTEVAAHQPLPIGPDTRPLNTSLCEALLGSRCEWTNSATSFLFRNIALHRGGASFPQLRAIAEREYHSNKPDSGAFPVRQFSEFLEEGYRSGLLVKNYLSPNGDIYSPERIVMFEIALNAQELLARYTPAEIEKRADDIPSVSEVDTQHLRERLTPVIEYLSQNGPHVRDTMLEDLTRNASDDTVEEMWGSLEDLIDQGIEAGILSQEGNRLGGKVVTLVMKDSSRP
jgi:hypothetical protein